MIVLLITRHSYLHHSFVDTEICLDNNLPIPNNGDVLIVDGRRMIIKRKEIEYFPDYQTGSKEYTTILVRLYVNLLKE